MDQRSFDRPDPGADVELIPPDRPIGHDEFLPAENPDRADVHRRFVAVAEMVGVGPRDVLQNAEQADEAEPLLGVRRRSC